MLLLVLFLLACYGTTNIVTASRLFAPLRARAERLHPELGRYVHCPMCVSVPIGIGWAALGLFPLVSSASTLASTPIPSPTLWAAAGMISSGWCWAMRVVMARAGEDQL